jgi:hypothetical protein
MILISVFYQNASTSRILEPSLQGLISSKPIFLKEYHNHSSSTQATGLVKVNLEMAIFRFDLENEISVCV